MICDLTPSVIYHRMFLGYSSKAIHYELETSLVSARMCRDLESLPLGIPETCLLFLAWVLSSYGGMIPNLLLNSIRHEACKGILGHFQDFVTREIEFGKDISKRMPKPDSHYNPNEFPIDPHGSEYACSICKRELPNSYFHCLGCESLEKDFNVCRKCLDAKHHRVNIGMHIGEAKKDKKKCSHQQGICPLCAKCES